MHNLTHIELSDLFDMLSMHTSLYMKMLSDGATREEFNMCRETITGIQREIYLRQGSTIASDSRHISLSQDHSHSSEDL